MRTYQSKFDASMARALADAGKNRRDAASAMGIGYARFTQCCRAAGIKFNHASKVLVDPRAEEMAALYKSGQTLKQIGDAYGVTRERVRQILRARTTVTRHEGGQSVAVAIKRKKRQWELDEKTLRRLGITWDEYRRFLAIGREYAAQGKPYRSPLRAFISQHRAAIRRGIGWELTFGQWWQLWTASGRWSERGRGNSYMMCRKGDVGPYAVGNVFIATGCENSSQANNKKGFPIGVSIYRGRYRATRMVNGRRSYLGIFDTPEQAHAAYLMAGPLAPSEAA